MKSTNTLLIILIVLLGACGVPKKSSTAYHSIKLYNTEDYQKKLNSIVNYLKDFDGSSREICYYFCSDIELFVYDIQTELKENIALNAAQTDSLQQILKQSQAIQEFMTCLADCQDEDRFISTENIETAADLLGFYIEEKYAGKHCVQIIQSEKAEFLIYFLANPGYGQKKVSYSFQNVNGKSFVGTKLLNSMQARPIYSRFNENDFDYMQKINLKCR